MPNQKIIYISASVILALLLIWSGYFLGIKKERSQKETQLPEKTVVRDNMETGSVGEVMAKEEKTGQEAPLVSPLMPPTIFSTAGKVTKIESDRVVISSNGTHFADGVPREVAAVFSTETFTFVSGQAFKWQGLAGLKQLQPGMEILVDSSENIRGKVEFKAKTINIL